MKRFFANPMMTPEYGWWWGKRVNDNIPSASQKSTRPIEEHLQVIPSKLEIVKQDFERKSSNLGEEDRKVERGKDSARIRHRRLKVRSRENEER
ncbi:hypothetical protein Gogos_003627, partial [Gossypium gossypioides]|nr:hypothetical protein [Gossypium gossypioides]